MKKILFGLCCSLIFSTVSAQDLILKKNADEIQAKVLKVSDTQIEYKKWDNLDGPIYTIPSSEVFIIKYQNGTKDVVSSVTTTRQRLGYSGIYPKYQGEIAAAYGVGVGVASDIINTNRIVLETVHGVRINPYLFTGMGLGFNYFYSLLGDYTSSDTAGIDDTAGVLPIFVDLKGYYPVAKKVSLYLAFDMGAAIGVSGLAESTEFYTSIGPGVQLANANGNPCCDFSIQFQHMGEGLNAILFRIGFMF